MGPSVSLSSPSPSSLCGGRHWRHAAPHHAAAPAAPCWSRRTRPGLSLPCSPSSPAPSPSSSPGNPRCLRVSARRRRCHGRRRLRPSQSQPTPPSTSPRRPLPPRARNRPGGAEISVAVQSLSSPAAGFRAPSRRCPAIPDLAVPSNAPLVSLWFSWASSPSPSRRVIVAPSWPCAAAAGGRRRSPSRRPLWSKLPPLASP